MEFKTPKQLLDFVLTECGDMKYSYAYVHLTIENNTDIERIYYAFSLLKTNNLAKIDTLQITDPKLYEIPEGWLHKLHISELSLPENVRIIPKLPYSLNYLEYNDDICYRISEKELDRIYHSHGDYYTPPDYEDLTEFYLEKLDMKLEDYRIIDTNDDKSVLLDKLQSLYNLGKL